MKRKDEFASINEEKKRGSMMVFAIAVLAICISGALCAVKLHMDQRYISMKEEIGWEAPC